MSTSSKYWYNHDSGKLIGFPAHIEHDAFLKNPQHAHKLGISAGEASAWHAGRTKATMFSGKKPPLFVYSREGYDKGMQDKVFKGNTRVNVVSKDDRRVGSVHQISVHTHSLKEFPHAQMAVLHVLDHHGFDPDHTIVNHETVEHGDSDVALAVPARDYVTTNSARKMWSRHAGPIESVEVDNLLDRILEGDDVDRSLTEFAAVYYHFYGTGALRMQKELA